MVNKIAEQTQPESPYLERKGLGARTKIPKKTKKTKKLNLVNLGLGLARAPGEPLGGLGRPGEAWEGLRRPGQAWEGQRKPGKAGGGLGRPLAGGVLKSRIIAAVAGQAFS